MRISSLSSGFHTFTLILGLIVLLSGGFAGELYSQQQGQGQRQFKLLGLSVQGNNTASAEVIKANSGLEIDEFLTGERIQKAIDRLWELGLFSDIRILVDRQTPAGVYLVIQVEERPRLNKVVFEGNKKIKRNKFEEELEFIPGQVISQDDIQDAVKKMKELYREKNFLLVEIRPDTNPVEGRKNYVNVVFDIDEGKKVKLFDITFHGNETFSGARLRRQMEHVKEERWWKLFTDAEYNRENLLEDEKKIVEFYKSEGYRDVEVVRDSVYYNDERTRMFVDLWIQEGIQYTYAGFSWEGNTLFDDEQLKRSLGIETGETYDYASFQTGLENIRSLYMDRGYLYFNIQPNEVPVGRDSVRVNFRIQENHQVSVRLIDITGNTKTKEDVIRRELRIFPGDVFSRDKLIRSQREIFILNYFSNVVPDVVPVNEQNVDLSIEVEEKQTDRANASIGYSERDGLIGSVGLEFNNFLGNGQKIGLNFQKSQYYDSFRASFNEPWPFNRPNPVGFSLFYTQRGQNRRYWYPFDLTQRGGSISIGHRFQWPDNYFQANWTLYGDIKNYSNIQDSTAYQNWNRTGANPTRGVRITQTIRRDSRDRPEFPTQGSRLTFRSTLSGGPLGGNEDYHKHELQIEWFAPLVWNFVLYSDIEMGALKGLKSNVVIPYEEHFFMGGSGMTYGTALRGYEERSVGPTSGGYPLGGRALMKYSLELRLKISDNPTVYGISFVESGNVYNRITSMNPFDLKRSAGFGVRLFMPMLGMLGFDLGYGLDPRTPGGEPAGWNTHFIFGQPF